MITGKNFFEKIVLGIVTGVFIYYVLTHWFGVGVEKPINSPIKNRIVVAKSTSNSVSNEVNRNNTSVVTSLDTPRLTDTDVSDAKKWNQERGYFAEEDIKAYANYDDATLKVLGRNGDILALEVLSKNAMNSQLFSLAKDFSWQAAVFGSTTALDRIAGLLEPEPDHKGDVAYAKPKIIEQLAIYKLAELRGDTRIASIGSKDATKNYERYFGKLELTNDDISIIDQIAKEKFNYLQEERNKLGLGIFDNSTPKFISETYRK